MSPRFEVLVNGQRICIAGVDGDGVVSIGLSYAKRPDTDGSTHFHVGGLGCFQGQAGEQHVGWVVPAIGQGDEITIRVLSEGDYDPPAGMTPHPQCTIEDPVLGSLQYSIDAWDGDIPFPVPPFERAYIHLVGDESGPSELHRALIHELVRRHVQLWPEIAESIVKCAGCYRSVSEMTDQLSPNFSIDIYDESTDLNLTYQLNTGTEELACGITLRDWELVEVYQLR